MTEWNRKPVHRHAHTLTGKRQKFHTIGLLNTNAQTRTSNQNPITIQNRLKNSFNFLITFCLVDSY